MRGYGILRDGRSVTEHMLRSRAGIVVRFL